MDNINYSDFKNICRTCKTNCDVKFLQDNVIRNVFHKLTDIHFQANQELPQQICLNCFEKMKEIHEFAYLCQRTHFSLLKCLNNFKSAVANKDQENLIEITEIGEEITFVKREIGFLNCDDLNSQSNYVIDELNLIDIENKLNKNLNPEVDDDQDQTNSKRNCLEKDDLNQSIEVENGEMSNESGNIIDLIEDNHLENNSESLDLNSKVNKKKTKKTKDEQYKCDACNKCFTSAKLFKTHKSKNCHVCKHCSKQFKSQNGLNKHLRSHSSERSLIKCKYCLKLFYFSYEYKCHMRSHTNERPYKCKQCPKTFRHSSNLNGHLLTHSTERPYKCDQCSKSFIQNSYLRSHLLTHSTERPFTCNQCDKTYRHSKTLKKHIRLHHELKVTK